jgi:hypothetical protein
MSKNIEQTIPATFIQSAEYVMVSKLSGYNHSVCGHGRQHVGPKRAEQNLPSMTERRLSVAMSQIERKSEGFDASKNSDNLQPPVAGNWLASRKGVGQAPWPNTFEVFDIFRIAMYGCRRSI